MSKTNSIEMFARKILKEKNKEFDFSLKDKLNFLKNLKKVLEKNQEKLAVNQALETFKPIKFCRLEIERCFVLIENAQKEIKKKKNKTGKIQNYFYQECNSPQGIVLGIMPFSSPYSSFFHKYLPATMSNNVFIWKPSPFAWKCSRLLYELIHKELGLKRLFFFDDKKIEITDFIKRTDLYDVILFTGNSETACKIKKLIKRKKAIFETGSSALVYIDSNREIEKIAKNIILSSFNQTGMRCIAARNIFVQKNIANHFVKFFVQLARELKMGDELDDETVIGKINKAHLKKLENIIYKYKKLNTDFLTGGNVKDNYLAPTIIEVKDLNTLSVDDCFGPICFLHRINKLEEIHPIYWKSSTLSTSVYTNKIHTIKKMTKLSTNSGFLEINFGPAKRFDTLPFGGFSNENEGKEDYSTLEKFLSKQRFIIRKIE